MAVTDPLCVTISSERLIIAGGITRGIAAASVVDKFIPLTNCRLNPARSRCRVGFYNGLIGDGAYTLILMISFLIVEPLTFAALVYIQTFTYPSLFILSQFSRSDLHAASTYIF